MLQWLSPMHNYKTDMSLHRPNPSPYYACLPLNSSILNLFSEQKFRFASEFQFHAKIIKQ